MRDIQEGIGCLIISHYKYTIWLYRNLATYKKSVAKENTITANRTEKYDSMQNTYCIVEIAEVDAWNHPLPPPPPPPSKRGVQ